MSQDRQAKESELFQVLTPEAMTFTSLLYHLSVYIRKHLLKITKLIHDGAEFKMQFHQIPNASLLSSTPHQRFPRHPLSSEITFIAGLRRSPRPSSLS